jgi:hypothetical protein
MRLPLAKLSLTKSMLQTSLTVWASCSGTPSDAGRLTFLRRRTARFAALYSRYTRLWFTVRTQQIVDASVAKAPARLGDLDDLAAQIFGHLVRLRRVAVTVSGEPHKAAGAALGQLVLDHQLADRFAFGLWG